MGIAARGATIETKNTRHKEVSLLAKPGVAVEKVRFPQNSSLDSIWKVAHWEDFTSLVRDSGWWGIPMFALALSIRFAVMGFALFLYLRLKNAPQDPPLVTKTTKNASVRSLRIIHIVLLVAIVMYALVAERLLRPASNAPIPLVEVF